jgi:hypothetical protein
MKKLLSKSIIAGTITAVSTLGLSGIALASPMTKPVIQVYKADLTSLNNSGATGTSYVAVEGNQVTVLIQSTGLSPNLPHAQHIHIGGTHMCPTLGADANHDGLISTSEGMDSYGDALIGLTTTGDVSVNSELAVNRYPNANPDGTLTYLRTFTLPAGVSAADVANGVVVQHGDSSIFGDVTMYDGSAKDIEVSPTLPLEATIPADCAKLVPVAAFSPIDATMMHEMHVDMSQTTSQMPTGNTSSSMHYYPNAQPSAYYVLPGQSIGVNGQSFEPNEQVVTTNQTTGKVVSTTHADGSGSVSANNAETLTYADKNTTQSYKVMGMMSNTTVNFNVKVGDYYPQINPSTYYLGHGQQMSVSGNSYAPNEPVDVQVNGQTVMTVTAGSDGSFTATLTAPSNGGSFTISGNGTWTMDSSARTVYLAQ